MEQHDTEIAGLSTIVAGSAPGARIVVVILHGYAMVNTDLAAFAHSMRLPGLVLLPRAPHAVHTGGYAWWPIDADARSASMQQGPRDLFDEYPAGRDAARQRMGEFLAAVRSTYPQLPLALVGFSQGGMLACEMILHATSIDGLALLSASRLALREWDASAGRLRGLPVLVSHGRADDDLAYAAGENLRDWLSQAGATVCWTPFEGGHQIPLVVWRQLRKFLTALCAHS